MAGRKRTAVGRPSKYNNQIIECANAYLHGKYKEQGNAIPTVAGLAFALGVNRDTVYRWASVHPEFSDILKSIATAQEMLLIDGGLNGDFNSTITKLMLTKHGYSDKQETTVNGDMNVKVETTPISSIFEK